MLRNRTTVARYASTKPCSLTNFSATKQKYGGKSAITHKLREPSQTKPVVETKSEPAEILRCEKLPYELTPGFEEGLGFQ